MPHETSQSHPFKQKDSDMNLEIQYIHNEQAGSNSGKEKDHGGLGYGIVALQVQGFQFNPELRLMSLYSFPCCTCVCMGFFHVL